MIPLKAWRAQALSIRTHLQFLISIILSISVVITVYQVSATYAEKRNNISRQILETTRTLSAGVDREIVGIRSGLQALATSPAIDAKDYARFHAQARMLLTNYPDVDIILADVTGQQLVNSHEALGAVLPKRNVPDRLRHVFETGETSVSGLYTGAITGRRFISIDVPVVRNGRVILELGGAVPVDRLVQTLSLQNLPPEWTATILDRNDVVVARTHDQEKFVGQKADMPVLAQHRRSSPEGLMEATGLAGVPVLVGYSQAPNAGWTLVISVPKSHVLHDLRSWLAWTIGSLGLLAVLGAALALRMGWTITTSIQSLIAPATALGRGEPVSLGRQTLAETNALAESLSNASQLLRQNQEAVKEREELLRLFIEHTPAAIAMLDTQMRYLRSSNAWSEQYQLDPPQLLIGRSHYEAFPELPERIKKVHRRCLDGAVERGEADYAPCADGTPRWISWEVRPWHDHTGAVGGLLIFREDVTERKRNEELRNQIEHTIRHDLKGPACNVIYVASILCGASNLTADQQELLKLFEYSGQSMLDILDLPP